MPEGFTTTRCEVSVNVLSVTGSQYSPVLALWNLMRVKSLIESGAPVTGFVLYEQRWHNKRRKDHIRQRNDDGRKE